MSDTDPKMTGRRKKSFTSKNWYFKNPACAYFPSYALMRSQKRRRLSEPPSILPRIESLPAPPPDYPGFESPEFLSFKAATHCTAANSANTSFRTLSSRSSEPPDHLPIDYGIRNKRPKSYTTVFVSLFVFVLIVAITFLIGLGILTDGFKHLTVEERCRERWSTKPSLTAFTSNSNQQSSQQFPHSSHPRPLPGSSNPSSLSTIPLSPNQQQQQQQQQITAFKEINSFSSSQNSNVCLTPDCVRIASSILTNMNSKVNPCENFYEFACGSYNGIKQVPESEKKITLFTEARTRLKYEIRELLDDTSLRDSSGSNRTSTSDISKLVYIYYDSCMDDQAQDLLDLMPIFSLVSSFGGWALLQNAKFEQRDFSWEMLESNLQLLGLNGLFKLTIKQSMPITVAPNGAVNGAGYLIVSQPQLLLGDRKLYSNSLGKNEYLQNYRTYMMDLLELFGADSEASEPQLNNVLNFERKIANITTPSSKLVKVNIQTLKSKFPKIIWKNFFNTEFFNLLPGFTESNLPLLVDIEYLQKLEAIISSTEPQTINDYLMWKLLSSFSSYLPQRYRIPHETIATLLRGQTIKPLWEECINEVIERLPIPMITIYNRLFNGGRYSRIEKSEIERIISDMKEALSQILLNIDWMDEETREAAISKLKNLKVNFNILKNFQSQNFENEILTQFNGLKLIGNTYFENTISIRKLALKNEFKKLNSSNFLNAFSSLTFEAFIELIPFNLYQSNEIILPTSLLQFPFYVLNAPNSINYGSIGAIISRELTHNFDDYGSNFDEIGARKNWWKEDTVKFFDSKKQCFIAQYNNKADSISGKKLDGKRTLRENIADNGSLRTAYAAYNLRLARQPDTLKLPALSNYTDHQLYFIAFANTYCESVKINSAQQLLDSEKTSPGLFRVNVPLQNFPAFSQAFNCPIGSGMNPYEKCRIW